jgi:hypothetical protein
VERELPKGVNVGVTYDRIRTVHMLRSRDINAPLPGTYDPQSAQSAIRPIPGAAEIFEYESSGIFNQRQLRLNADYRPGSWMTLWATYALSDAKSDTDGPETFPASTYNLSGEYGRSALDVRHTLYWGGWIRTKLGIDLAPLLLWRSGVPYNITTGIDSNRDSRFMERPAFATDLSRPTVMVTHLGAFDLSPAPGQRIIPRNFGLGPSFLVANLTTSRTISLTDRISMTISVQVHNLFNHTNPGLPIGNLSSPLFGVSNSSAGDYGFGSNQAGNRRVQLQMSLGF